jgi:tetratricopeptide (TPR) repeat protein
MTSPDSPARELDPTRSHRIAHDHRAAAKERTGQGTRTSRTHHSPHRSHSAHPSHQPQTNTTLALLLLLIVCLSQTAWSQAAKILEIENIVQASKGTDAPWTSAVKDQPLEIGEQVRTRQRSRAMIRLTDLYNARLERLTTVRITQGLVEKAKSRLDLDAGAIFIFSREKAGEIDIATPAANGALRGTQLYVEVGAGGRSFYQVIEGRVELANPQGKLMLEAGEAGEAIPGQAPRRTAVIEAKNLLQWSLYYPAVLDPGELGIPAGRVRVNDPSMAAYRNGDPLGALEHFGERPLGGQGGALYQAAVLLAVGRVDEVQGLMRGIPADHPGRRSIERVIAAVKFEEREAWPDATLKTAGEAMAESYYRQSRSDLKGSLDAARIATVIAPDNGYAWTRVAELEFSFGRTKQAKEALTKSLTLTPDNAQTHALHGFLLSAGNDMDAAAASFEKAIQLDGALGNGWLGRGLTRIKRGDLESGRADLQAAATAEPTNATFHSYLGKAFGMEQREDDARKDLDLARRLDPNDPTPLLYSALELQSGNETNKAIADLERSIELNDNRRVYRSRLLLDQDKAVRSANLARIYQNAGMTEVAVREASRAVESDYTNSSAHLFLANSFDALRDPKRIALRHETPWFNELLISNLLSPVGGGPLSQFVSQQEYSKLLEEDGLGGSISTEWRSDKETRAAASIFGASGDVSFGIDGYYRDDTGDRFNSEATLEEIYAQLKWQPTPDDIFYFLGKWADQQSGDNFETYDNQPLSPGFDFQESQEPGLLLAGWNHRWAPGSHTLFLAGRLGADQELSDPASQQLLILRDSGALPQTLPQPGVDGDYLIYSPALLQAIQPFLGTGDVIEFFGAPFAFATRRSFEIYTAEIQQVLQTERNLFLAGSRWQGGTFETDTLLRVDENFAAFSGGFSNPAARQHAEVDFERLSFYTYDYWSLNPCLTLIGGITWDHIEHPENFRNPPVSDRSREDEEWSAKVGFTYTPSRRFSARGIYAEGLGGVTYDESVRLEPVQLAGFNQAYRTVISESIAGSVETPQYKIWGLGLDGSLPTRTWWGVSGQVIEQDVDRSLGVFTGYDHPAFPIVPAFFPDQTSQRLTYREASASLTVNQLIGDEFSIGTGYRYTRSKLRTSLDFRTLGDAADLHEVSLYANWNSPTGWFARAEANWFLQELDDDPQQLFADPFPRKGDDFLQLNAWLGYRFNRNMCEVSAGVLNLGGSDYRLSPLSPHAELARDRTAVLRCRFSF